MKKQVFWLIFLVLFIFNAISVLGDQQIVDIDVLRSVALPLHIIEIILAVFICVMALKFFQLTKPFNLFLLIYIALGFFLINALLYVLLYTESLFGLRLSFLNVYLGGRFSLIAMLTSMGYMFVYVYIIIKKRHPEFKV
tara:strand:+ start:82441 stop:82857 length:417 start_codon:yes stop_codon:yes gene_type:complete